jgi:hypothetical protein
VTLFIPFVGISSGAGTAARLSSRAPGAGDGVVDFFPPAQFTVELFHFQRAGGDLIELLGMGTIGALDRDDCARPMVSMAPAALRTSETMNDGRRAKGSLSPDRCP